MSREEAIKLVALYDSKNCTQEDREMMIYNGWGIDEDDENFQRLNFQLRKELVNYNEPQDDVMSSKYDELVSIMCEEAYAFYSNNQLAIILSDYIGKIITIEGDEPKRYPCPCCEKKRLFTRGEYEICSCCGWEDDGNKKIHTYSSVNHMTLEQGRKNYKIFGNCIGKEM